MTAKRWVPVWLALASLVPNPAFAATWTMLQGTEEGRPETAFQPFGFIQPSYEQVFAEPVEGLASEALQPYNGRVAVFNTVGPEDSEVSFRVTRARLAARGTIPETDGAVNYFIMLAAGQNALVGDNGVALTDASITYNAPWFRLRAGQFKIPMIDESLEAVPISGDAIKFSNVTERLLFERPLVGGQFTGQAYGFRDLGVMAFDSHKVGDFELSYATWLTNGGAGAVNVGDGLDVGVWSQGAWLLDDRRFHPERDELALYAFATTGERNDTVETRQRTRLGGGIQYRQHGVRLRVEGVFAHGVIPGGATPPFRGEPVGLLDGDAWGITFLSGYRIVSWFEVNAGANQLRTAVGRGADARVFNEVVLGAQLFASAKAKLMLNGIVPWIQADEAGPDAKRILDTAAPRVVVQGTIAF
ncbi:MAG: hypothetical protein R3E66_02290 [bacterium]